MRQGKPCRIIGTALLASLAVPFTGLAQEQAQVSARKHARYTLVDMGTLGGSNSGINGGSVTISPSGTVVGQADTAVYDPDCDCDVSHAFQWRKGVLTDLGALPGGSVSSAIAINSRGTVTGTSENGLIDPVYGLPASVATIWNDGEITDLGTLGGGFSLPNAINDRGQVVGTAANTVADPDGLATLLIFGFALPGNQWHATLWKNGTIQDLGTLGDGPDSFALVVNESGQVAGFSYSDSVPKPPYGVPTVAPFLWDAGRMINLGTLGGVSGAAFGLNKRGQVVGGSNLEGASQTELHSHGFLWEKGSLRDLGTVPGAAFDFSVANALNDNGEIVGQAATADGAFRAFLWKRSAMIDLGVVEGYDCSNSSSINANGQVVGEAFPCDGSTPGHAVLWENQGPGIDLNAFVPAGSDLDLKEAMFINDRGEIAGAALLPNGDAHAFVLIPGEDDAEEIARVPGAARENVAPAAPRTVRAAHGTLTSDRKAALLSRVASRYLGHGLRLPKQAQ